MLPEARLCWPETEELRRLLKSGTILVRWVLAVKNQLHGLLLSLGIFKTAMKMRMAVVSAA